MPKGPHSPYVVDGMKIRILRDRAGWSLSRFAQAVDTDISHLSKVERGLHQPSASLRNRIAEALGISIDEIAELRAGADAA